MRTEPEMTAPAAIAAPRRYVLNGPTMGTRYAAIFFAAPRDDIETIAAALQASVDEVDEQMSTWIPESDLMQFNAAPVGQWMTLPAELLTNNILHTAGSCARGACRALRTLHDAGVTSINAAKLRPIVLVEGVGRSG